ncbi:MAG: DUF1292 domain-containing protein [Clostridia bacterium]|nr:DUF1292 domain-containing protein [Clostridia bacterium]MBO7319428.1 DUF1292 domain-containing protein [Clostridia bacterium]
MSELLNQLKDEELDFTVRFTDTDGEYGEYEFLDIVLYNNCEYVIVSPLDADGYVDIFRIMGVNDKEVYVRVQDDETLEKVFEIFRVKNEDEFDFE